MHELLRNVSRCSIKPERHFSSDHQNILVTAIVSIAGIRKPWHWFAYFHGLRIAALGTAYKTMIGEFPAYFEYGVGIPDHCLVGGAKCRDSQTVEIGEPVPRRVVDNPSHAGAPISTVCRVPRCAKPPRD